MHLTYRGLPACAGHRKSDGHYCTHDPRVGSTVCGYHGGSARQVVAKGLERAQRAEAEAAVQAAAAREVTRLGGTIQTTPVEALEAMLWESAANVAFLRRLVAALDDDVYRSTYHVIGLPTGEAKPHVLVTMYGDERDRFSRLAETALKLGLDERRVRVAETAAGRLFDAVAGALVDAGVDDTTAETFRRALGRRLRDTAAG